MLIVGSILGCLEPILTVSACLSYKSPFSKPFGKQEVRHPPYPPLETLTLEKGISCIHILTPHGVVYTNKMRVSHQPQIVNRATFSFSL